MPERKPFVLDADGRPVGLPEALAPHADLLKPLPAAFLTFDGPPARSKLGGAPLLPVGFDAPVGESRPLGLLAQIDFSEMPELPDFPTGGVLQIWVDPDDEMYGWDEDGPNEQTSLRVLYFGADEPLAPRGEDVVPAGMPLSEVHPISFTVEPDLPGVASVAEAIRRLEDPAPVEDALYSLHGAHDNENAPKIGGYPCFFNGHPGERIPEARDYDRVLLQLPSGWGSTVSIWGSGTASFLIPREKLLARDFTDVWYWLDR